MNGGSKQRLTIQNDNKHSYTPQQTNNKYPNAHFTSKYFDFMDRYPTFSSHNLQSRKAIEDYTICVLTYGNTWQLVLEAAKDEPTWLLAQLFACDFYLSAGMPDEASASFLLAKDLSESKEDIPVYEKLYLEAIKYWMDKDFAQACKTYTKLLWEENQSDLFAAKRAQVMAFYNGDEKQLLAVVAHAGIFEENKNKPYYNGLLGFALEQNGKLVEAEKAGRDGTSICRSDPWSHHAVAHALYFQCKLNEGIEWLYSLKEEWNSCGSFMKAHNWWHVGLFYLDACLLDEAMDLFSTRIWAIDKTNIQDQLGALGFLLKFELRRAEKVRFDAKYEHLWREVIDYSLKSPHITHHSSLLYDVFLLFALFKFNFVKEGEDLLSGCVESVKKISDPERALQLNKIYISLCKCMKMTASGAFTSCFEDYKLLFGNHQAVAGSSEQRDVIDELFIEYCLNNSELKTTVIKLIEHRITLRPLIPAEHNRLYRASGDENARKKEEELKDFFFTQNKKMFKN